MFDCFLLSEARSLPEPTSPDAIDALVPRHQMRLVSLLSGELSAYEAVEVMGPVVGEVTQLRIVLHPLPEGAVVVGHH